MDYGKDMAKLQWEIRRERARAADAAKESKGRIAALEKRLANLEGLALEEKGAQTEIPLSGGSTTVPCLEQPRGTATRTR